MKFCLKSYNDFKVMTSLKDTNCFLIFNQQAVTKKNKLIIRQELKRVGLYLYQSPNKTTTFFFKKSIFRYINSILNGTIYFALPFNPEFKLVKESTIYIEPLGFTLLILRFNNKIYSSLQFKTLSFFEYQYFKLIFLHFSLASLKFHLSSK